MASGRIHMDQRTQTRFGEDKVGTGPAGVLWGEHGTEASAGGLE